MIEILFFVVLVPQVVFTLIVIYNFFSQISLRWISTSLPLTEKTSILIPFRNEEKNVKDCLESVLNQEGIKNFEIICLNDNSEDGTEKLLLEFAKKYSVIKVIDGKPLPEGWIGKNWACHQLAENSSGDYLVFLDADVRLNRKAIISALLKIKELKVSMLSVFPTQIMKSLSEYLIVPSMNWLLLTFLPLKFIYKFSHPSFVAANGQFIVFEREAYFSIGGHKSVKDKFVEDMELARLFKKNGYRIVTLLGGDLIFARMYRNFKEAINGFSKNFFPGFNTSYFAFTIFLVLIFLCFLVPFIFVFFSIYFLIIIGLIFVQKIIISLISHQKIFHNLILNPIQFLIVVYVGFRSMIFTHKGKLEWKGRRLISKS
jgi:chlorobactene glucosyltransferase